MALHIGVIAVSPEGSALCYRKLAQRASAIGDTRQRPPLTVHNIPFADYLEAMNEGRWEDVAGMLLRSAQRLHAAGAEFCILPDNLAHHAAPMARASSPLPWLSMIDLVADAVTRDARTTMGLIGTRALMTGSVYQTVLGLRGVKVIVPHKEQAERIDKIIFGELIHGSVTGGSRTFVLETLDDLAGRGCEGVILGSTETPLLVADAGASMALYDPVDLLVCGAMAVATGEAPMPEAA